MESNPLIDSEKAESLSKALDDEINQRVMELVQAASKEEVAVIGFAWGVEPPRFLMFTNCKEDTDKDLHKLFDALLDLRKSKVEQGGTVPINVGGGQA